MTSKSICLRCLLRSRTRLAAPPSARPISTAIPRPAPPKAVSAKDAETSTPQRNRPAVTSTAAAQPFSAPNASAKPDLASARPSPEARPSPAEPPKPPRVVSSVPAGTRLTGLNYFKNREDPVAMADDEYPDWLWRVLDKKATAGSQKEETDPKLFANSPAQRRAARKRQRAKQKANPAALQDTVPVYEQSIDLPGRDAAESFGARHELTKAMRDKRRRDIKETNFLQEMR